MTRLLHNRSVPAYRENLEPTFRALAPVCELTAAKGSDLQKATCDPGVNPTRRFAVWALKDRMALTHAQIDTALNMSTPRPKAVEMQHRAFQKLDRAVAADSGR